MQDGVSRRVGVRRAGDFSLPRAPGPPVLGKEGGALSQKEKWINSIK